MKKCVIRLILNVLILLGSFLFLKVDVFASDLLYTIYDINIDDYLEIIGDNPITYATIYSKSEHSNFLQCYYYDEYYHYQYFEFSSIGTFSSVPSISIKWSFSPWGYDSSPYQFFVFPSTVLGEPLYFHTDSLNFSKSYSWGQRPTYVINGNGTWNSGTKLQVAYNQYYPSSSSFTVINDLRIFGNTTDYDSDYGDRVIVDSTVTFYFQNYNTPTPTPTVEPTPTPTVEPTPTPTVEPTPTPTPEPIGNFKFLVNSFKYNNTINGISSGSGSYSDNSSFSGSSSLSGSMSSSGSNNLNSSGVTWYVTGSTNIISTADYPLQIAGDQDVFIPGSGVSGGYYIWLIVTNGSDHHFDGYWATKYNPATTATQYWYSVVPVNLETMTSSGTFNSSEGSFSGSSSSSGSFSESGSFNMSNPDESFPIVYSIDFSSDLFDDIGTYDLYGTLDITNTELFGSIPSNSSGAFSVDFSNSSSNAPVHVSDSSLLYIDGKLISHVTLDVIGELDDTFTVYMYGNLNLFGSSLSGNLLLTSNILNINYKSFFTSAPVQNWQNDISDTLHGVQNSLDSASGANDSTNFAINDLNSTFDDYKQVSDTSGLYTNIGDDLFTFDTSLFMQLAPTITLFSSVVTLTWNSLGDFAVVLSLFLIVSFVSAIIGVIRYQSSIGSPPSMSSSRADEIMVDKGFLI